MGDERARQAALDVIGGGAVVTIPRHLELPRVPPGGDPVSAVGAGDELLACAGRTSVHLKRWRRCDLPLVHALTVW